jgi:hypothetical protein
VSASNWVCAARRSQIGAGLDAQGQTLSGGGNAAFPRVGGFAPRSFCRWLDSTVGYNRRDAGNLAPCYAVETLRSVACYSLTWGHSIPYMMTTHNPTNANSFLTLALIRSGQRACGVSDVEVIYDD